MTDQTRVDELTRALSALGDVRAKKMFGDWGVYIDGRFAAIIGAGRLYIKVKGVPDEMVDALLGNREQPYDGASNYARADESRFDDEGWVENLRAALVSAGVLPPA